VLVEAGCQLLSEGAPTVDAAKVHRLGKADTQKGIASVQTLSGLGVPYAMLLYERYLGRPFAGHRDSVSELVGDNLESAIEDVLSRAGVSYRKTKRAERVPGFDQAPDFIIPSEFNPKVIIEAKITEDDGTARDKVTRIQHLGELSLAGRPADQPKFDVIACIAGRGFGVRRDIRNGESLLVHAHECGEVVLVVHSDVARKPGRPLAIEDHQLCQAGRFANCLPVTGNGLLGFGDRLNLLPKDIRPKPPIYRLLVGFQHVFGQAQTGVKKRLVVLVRSVEILAKPSNPVRSKPASLALTSIHVGCDFG